MTLTHNNIGAQLRRLEAEAKALYRTGVHHRILRNTSADDLLILVAFQLAARNARLAWEERAGTGTAIDRTNVTSIVSLLSLEAHERKRGA